MSEFKQSQLHSVFPLQILPCDIRQFLFSGLPLLSVVMSYNIHYQHPFPLLS